MIVFGTFANSNYLPQLLSMLESFQNYITTSRIAVIALDESTKTFVQGLKSSSIDLFSVEELEEEFQILRETKKNRTISENFFTLTSAIPNFLLQYYPESDFVCYVDADIFFFNNPEKCITNLEAQDNVLITPHNFSHENFDLKVFGEFNTGFVVFRNNSHGVKVSRWWFEQCIKWCKDYVEEGRFADQKYLEDFPRISAGVKVSQDFGLNLGPWGLNSLKIVSEAKGRIQVNNQELVAFHFSGLRWNRHFLLLGLSQYRYKLSESVFSLIYKPYLTSIRKWENYILLKNSGLPVLMGLKSLRATRKVTFGVLIKSLIRRDFKCWKGIPIDTH